LNRAINGDGLDTDDGGDTNQGSRANTEEPWSMDKLRAYIAVVKEKFQPVMSDEAAMLLESHYEKCRSCQSNTIPVTVRFLESLIRLSQAHARLMYRNEVTIQDAVAVIRLMECSAFAYGGFDGTNVLDQSDVMYCDPMTVDFSDEADVEFACWEHRILTRYNMLDYMPPDRRETAARAMAYVRGTQGSGWEHFEDARERR
jgi:DNA helicase MCM9